MLVNTATSWTRMAVLALALGCVLRTPAYGFEGGTGEPNDPYRVATAQDLRLIGTDPERLKKHFVLVADIDLDPNLPGGRVFEDAVIAPDNAESPSSHSGQGFSGVLDGQGHTIRNLTIMGKPGHDAGLFGMFSGLVKDLKLENVRIDGAPCGAIAGSSQRGVMLRCSVTGQLSGGDYVAGLAGSLWDGTIMDCRAEVQVTGVDHVGGIAGGGPGGTLIRCETRAHVQGDSLVGGLAGDPRALHTMDSRATGAVVGTDSVGGLVGRLHGPGMILRCVSDCDVVAQGTAGGLAGDGRFAQGALVMDCRATGSVAGSLAGGLFGIAVDMRILSSYAACEMIPMAPETPDATAGVGGLFGEASEPWPPLVKDCFWDIEVSQAELSAGVGTQYAGTGLTTEQMQQRSTFEQAGWDFVSTWALPEGGYPVLQWELAGSGR